jgi:hypothetical protein
MNKIVFLFLFLTSMLSAYDLTMQLDVNTVCPYLRLNGKDPVDYPGSVATVDSQWVTIKLSNFKGPAVFSWKPGRKEKDSSGNNIKGPNGQDVYKCGNAISKRVMVDRNMLIQIVDTYLSVQ